MKFNKLKETIEGIDDRIIPELFTPFPNKRSRDKVLNDLGKLFKSVPSGNVISWVAILLNSFYSQDRVVCAVTRDAMKKLCLSAGREFPDKQWKNLIRVCCDAQIFECRKGRPGQPWIFVLIEANVLEGIGSKLKECDLETLKVKQLAQVNEFVNKAPKISELISPRRKEGRR